jgi:nitrogenase molybdenum-iron protein alpha/beta subunit
MASNRLSEFRVPYDYIAPYLDGVCLAVNAIPDAYLVYDAHNCGYHNAEKIAGNHDLFSDLMRWDQMNRIVRTDLDSREYIMGSEDKLSMKIRQVAERYRPGIVLVVRSNIVIVAGHDAEPVIRDLATKFDVPIILLSDKSVEGDHVTGYLHALAALVSRLDLRPAHDECQSVCIAGYVFDRNEGDHQGNVAEFEWMLAGIGVRPGPVLLSGRSWSEWGSMIAPQAVIDVAGEWDGARRLAERANASYLHAQLPLGIEGTCAWLRAVATTVGLPCDPEPFIDEELRRLVPTLQWILPRYFFGRTVMVFADRLLLSPLLAFVEELGLRVTAIGSTSVDYDEGTQQPRLPRAKYATAPRLTDELHGFFVERRQEGEVDLVIGNALIHQIAKLAGIPCVELGYPSRAYHALRPSPFVGFGGVRVLVERMINALEGEALALASK